MKKRAKRPERIDPASARSAIRIAYARFLKAKAERERPQFERQSFAQLRLGARALREALDALLAPEGRAPLAALLWRLQETPPVRSQGAHRLALQGLQEQLETLLSACDRHLGDGRGRAPERLWPWLCADAWLEATGRAPSAAEEGAFLRALRAAQRDTPRAPTVTRDQLRALLPEWQRAQAWRTGG